MKTCKQYVHLSTKGAEGNKNDDSNTVCTYEKKKTNATILEIF